MARYNLLGEWKPYIANRDEVFARSAAGQLAGEDFDVYGALFYVFFTGHHVLEFAAAASVELPEQQVDFAGGRLHLWRCPPIERLQNEVVYDGWWDLADPSPDEVRAGLQKISQVVNRLAFAFNSSVQWRQKYKPIAAAGGFATPQPEDIPLLDQYLRLRVPTEENAVLDAAIDWYARARLANNAFTAFLSYYVPIETVAIAIAGGIADFGMSLPRQVPSQRRATREACVRRLHDHEYDDDPAGFVRHAYFECIGSVRAQVRAALQHVFGSGGLEVVAVLDDSPGKPSLMTLRGRVAHGHYALADPEHVAEIRGRTAEMAKISRSFLARLILQLPADEEMPAWSGKHRAGISFTDPRELHSASEVAIRSGDWRIRPSWCKS
jgi:hypothetical protein